MDHYGIGAAVKGALHILASASRRTGRSTCLLESLKDGDRVVFLESKEATRFARLAKERKLKIDCIVVPVGSPMDLFQRSTSEGRTLFDHSWVEVYYQRAIDRCITDLDHLQREASGYGTAHVETRMQAEQIYRWS